MKNAEVIQIGIDEVPLPSTYGAAELKFYIRKNTYRGAIITLILLLLFLIINFIMATVEKSKSMELKVAPIVKTSLEELPPQDDGANELPPPPDIVINTGPAARAGNPIPVPDAMIAPDLQDFATIDVIDRASSTGGDGEDLGGFSGNINWDNVGNVQSIKEKEPDPDDFIPVEKEPAFDMGRLQRSVVYPDMARRAGIEGTVLVRALVDKSGKVVRAQIDHSDNKALDQAAIKAVLDYGHATPAIMNGQPTTCWVSIPIVFKLK